MAEKKKKVTSANANKPPKLPKPPKARVSPAPKRSAYGYGGPSYRSAPPPPQSSGYPSPDGGPGQNSGGSGPSAPPPGAP